ncbi:16549_t:CDS:1, partial [Acaulospora colombiana]
MRSLSISPHDKDQVYNLTKDEVRYTQRYYDSRDATQALGKFSERVDLEDLLNRPEKLLHFGSLFSGARVVMKLQSSKKFKDNLMRSMTPSNPEILRVVESIISRMGGDDKYVGIHARLGPGFSNVGNQTIQRFIDQLKYDFSKNNSDNIMNSKNVINSNLNQSCYPKFDSKSPIVIYLATDVHRDNVVLRPLLEMFPCVYVLNDFQIESMNITNPLDGTNMFKYLVSFVDALVAAR